MNQHPNADRLAQATSEDRLAISALLLPYCDPLSRHIDTMMTGKLRRVVDTDDVLQLTMVAAIRALRQYQPRSNDSLLAWLKTIANHQICDIARAADRQKRGNGAPMRRVTGEEKSSSVRRLMELLSEGIEPPSHRARQEEDVQAVRLGVAALPDEQRQAVKVHHFDGRSVDETAAALQRSPAAVRGLLHRARRSLKSTLSRLSD